MVVLPVNVTRPDIVAGHMQKIWSGDETTGNEASCIMLVNYIYDNIIPHKQKLATSPTFTKEDLANCEYQLCFTAPLSALFVHSHNCNLQWYSAQMQISQLHSSLFNYKLSLGSDIPIF